MQLSLNPAVTEAQLKVMLTSLTKKITADNNHFYIYGEPRRLARAALYIVYQGIYSKEEIATWFSHFTSPAPFALWGDMYTSQAGLAKIHNTRSFLSELFILSQTSKNSSVILIKEHAENSLKKIN